MNGDDITLNDTKKLLNALESIKYNCKKGTISDDILDIVSQLSIGKCIKDYDLYERVFGYWIQVNGNIASHEITYDLGYTIEDLKEQIIVMEMDLYRIFR